MSEDKIKWTFWFDKELKKKVEAFAKKDMSSAARIVHVAIKEYLERHSKE